MIARCLTPADAAAAVRWGRESDLEISIRGGGHNVAGKVVTDGGVMIDLSLMKKTQIDSDVRTIAAEGGTSPTSWSRPWSHSLAWPPVCAVAGRVRLLDLGVPGHPTGELGSAR